MRLEAERIAQRTRYDIEMLREIGFCTGIENYSRYFDGRQTDINASSSELQRFDPSASADG